MPNRKQIAVLALASLLPLSSTADQRTVNNGNLVLEDIPEIPKQIAQHLNQYQIEDK